jgi:hypothetical protein
MVKTKQGEMQTGIDETERLGAPVVGNEIAGAACAFPETFQRCEGTCRIGREDVKHLYDLIV